MIEFCKTIYYETPDGLRIYFTNADNRVLSHQGMGVADIQNIVAQGVNQHGVTLVDSFYRERIITLNLRIHECGCYGLCAGVGNPLLTPRFGLEELTGCSPKMSYDVSMAVLTNMTRYRCGAGRLFMQFPDQTTRSIGVFPAQLPQINFDSRAGKPIQGYTGVVRFLAPSPFFQSEPRRVGTGDPFTVINVETCGTAITFPDIVLTGRMSPPIRFFNSTVGQFFVLDYTLAFGEQVTIRLSPDDQNRQVKTVTSDLVGDITGAVTSTSQFADFYIAPDPEALNGRNVMAITWLPPNDLGVTRYDLTWRDQFISAVI